MPIFNDFNDFFALLFSGEQRCTSLVQKFSEMKMIQHKLYIQAQKYANGTPGI